MGKGLANAALLTVKRGEKGRPRTKKKRIQRKWLKKSTERLGYLTGMVFTTIGQNKSFECTECGYREGFYSVLAKHMKKEIDQFKQDFRDCIVTFEQAEAQLKEIEQKVAERYGIEPDRQLILQKFESGELSEEDPLMREWDWQYSWYLSYFEEEDAK